MKTLWWSLAAAVVFQLLWLDVTGARTHPLLLVVSEEREGNKSTINVQSTTGASSKEYFFSERLSPACSLGGDRTRRCREVFTVQVNNETHLVLVPLMSGNVGVQELRLNGSELVGGEREVISNTLNCVILDILMSENIVVAPCLSSTFLHACYVELNDTHLSSSYIFCRNLYNFGRQFNASDYPFISNFEHFRDQQFYFAIHGDVYWVDFSNHDAEFRYSFGESDCERLKYRGGSLLYAYCGSTIAVDIELEVRSTRRTLNGTGITYECPAPVTAREEGGVIHLEYGGKMISTNNSNFEGGLCDDEDFFFLVDTLQGITVLDVRTGRFSSLANSARTSTLVLLDGYVVAIKDEPGNVLLYNTESLRSSSSADAPLDQLVVWTGEAAAVGVLLVREPSTPDSNLAIELGAGLAGGAVLLYFIVQVIGFTVHRCRRRRCQQVDLGNGGGNGAGNGRNIAGNGGNRAGNGANGDGGANQQGLPAVVAVPPNPIQNDGSQQGTGGNSANDGRGANPQVPAAVVAGPAPIQGRDGQPGDDPIVPQQAGQHSQQPELVLPGSSANSRPPHPARPPPLDHSTGQPAGP